VVAKDPKAWSVQCCNDTAGKFHRLCVGTWAGVSEVASDDRKIVIEALEPFDDDVGQPGFEIEMEVTEG
jgi:hypothetical protein